MDALADSNLKPGGIVRQQGVSFVGRSGLPWVPTAGLSRIPALQWISACAINHSALSPKEAAVPRCIHLCAAV